MFLEHHNLDQLKPASYNPRDIDDESLRVLGSSIRRFGVVRAIIASSAGTIIAGHQRTKAMVMAGLESTPAHVLDGVSLEDEIRFNQLHNASDVDLCDANLRVVPDVNLKPGTWCQIRPNQLIVESRPSRGAAKLNELCRLLSLHGPWGNAIATPDGRIIALQMYAYACSIVRSPIHLRVVPQSDSADLVEALGRSYGVFSYGRLPRTTWVQSLAQLHRLRRGRHGRGKSRTYEDLVLPSLHKGMRLLDFGAGQMDYVRMLRRRGFNAIGVEFFRRKPGRMEIDLQSVHRDIDRLCNSLRERGLFDVVVCDSVLNSVDTPQAEADVLTTVNAICRPGGLIVFSGRRMAFESRIEHGLKWSRSAFKRGVYFLDDRGFTALYQRGVWLFQRFHSDDDARSLGLNYIGSGASFRTETSGWACWGNKTAQITRPEASILREFDLPLPDGSRFGRGDDLLDAWRAAKARG